MKKYILMVMFLALLLLAGCKDENTITTEDTLLEVSYDFGITPTHCPKEIKLNGDTVYFYDVINESDSWLYEFYYAGKDGIVNEIGIDCDDVIVYAFMVNENKNILTFEFDYWAGEYYLSEYSTDGKVVSKNVISGTENLIGSPYRMETVGTAGNVLFDGMNFYRISDNVMSAPITLQDKVRDYAVKGENIFAVTEDGNHNIRLTKIDIWTEAVTTIKSAESELYSLYACEGGFFAVSPDYVYFYDESKEEFIPRLSLLQSGLSLEKINYIVGCYNDFDVLSWRVGDRNSAVKLINYAKDNGGAPIGRQNDTVYTADGRKIITVLADSRQGDTLTHVVEEFNDNNDKYYAEIMCSETSVLDRIGRGDKTDVIIVDSDKTIRDLATKGIIRELGQLIDASEKYSIDDFEPKAREVLSVNGKLYGVADAFELSLRATYRDEYDENGKCDVVSFLGWYDEYMDEIGINTIDWWRMEPIISFALLDFVNSETGTSSFDSSECKEILSMLKEMCEGGNETDDSFASSERTDLALYGGNLIAGYSAFVQNKAKYNIEIAGFPDCNGMENVYISVGEPMAITQTSDDVEGALEFIMHYVYYDVSAKSTFLKSPLAII